jgi:hypothetical protein
MRIKLIVTALAIAFAASAVSPAMSQSTDTAKKTTKKTSTSGSADGSKVTATGCTPEKGKPYFVEFRSRTAVSYGHTFLFFGKLGNGNRFGKFEVAGLHPKGDDPGVYMQGHAVPVPSETGASDGDLDEQYLTARYCVVLTEAEYKKVVTFIRELQAKSTTWHAPTKNCNTFAGEVAQSIGLKAPVGGILLPEHYVSMLRTMNGAKEVSAPAQNFMGMPMNSWSRTSSPSR